MDYENTYGYAIINGISSFCVASKTLIICDLIQWHTKDTTPDLTPPDNKLLVHLQSVEYYNCGKKGHYSNDCSLPKKNTQSANMVSKDDFKNIFQTSMKEMFTKNKDKKAKANAEGDDNSLDMNVFEKLMEGKQPMFVIENNDDLI
jgi:hypothetical protein